jgi:hypothetical protein
MSILDRTTPFHNQHQLLVTATLMVVLYNGVLIVKDVQTLINNVALPPQLPHSEGSNYLPSTAISYGCYTKISRYALAVCTHMPCFCYITACSTWKTLKTLKTWSTTSLYQISCQNGELGGRQYHVPGITQVFDCGLLFPRCYQHWTRPSKQALPGLLSPRCCRHETRLSKQDFCSTIHLVATGPSRDLAIVIMLSHLE